MGVVIDICKLNAEEGNHANAADDFATDGTGRLIPFAGEVFELLSLGSLDVLAYMSVRDRYQQNPYTFEGMRWEIGFSEKRISFFSPDTNQFIGGIETRPDRATLGFYYYNELRSLSLGSAREDGGPYVSMAFIIQINQTSQIPIGVRVHGSVENLHTFATLLAARVVGSYAKASSMLTINTDELGFFFESINSYNYQIGMQTDLFLSASANTIRVTREVAQPQQGEK